MNTSRGFVALFSVLLFSAMMLVFVVALSTRVFLVHQSLRGEVEYRTARADAYTCLHAALSRITVDPYRFENGVPVRIIFSQNRSCEILEASTTDAFIGILVRAHAGNSWVTALGKYER